METVLALSLSGSALALLLLCLRYVVLRRMPSTLYYYAWLLVLLRFALPLPGLIPTVFGTEAAQAPAYSETHMQAYNAQLPVLPHKAVPDGASAVTAQPQLPVQAAQASEAQAPASAREHARPLDWRSPGLWLTIWALGAALSLGLTVLAYLRFTSRLRRTLHGPDPFIRACYASIPGRKPALFLSDAIGTPLMFGLFSPKIVLPEREYGEELLCNILRHELTHYRRLDTLYKWLAVAILSLHWFNPLSWLIRRELNRACELSCDEMLLRSMTREEKEAYGNTLLLMATARALPAGVVATSFATEKRNLKERLVQIMQYKKSGARMLAAMLALVLLAGCAAAAGPAEQKTTVLEAVESSSGSAAVRVTSVDELLAAIAPHTVIELAAGEYDLSTASDYGADSHSAYYSWNGTVSEDGQTAAELVIHELEGLTLRGAGLEETTIAAVPRYANVIRFVGCRNLALESLTAGHTREPGFCAGGVLKLENCDAVSIEACGLYGCGTIGVDAAETSGLKVSGCKIYECSYEAVNLHSCRDVRIDNCSVYRHGTRAGQGPGMALFSAAYSDGVVICSNSIFENASQGLLNLSYTKNAAFLSNSVHDNRFDGAVFMLSRYAPVVDGCSFENNGRIRQWVQTEGVYPFDVTGKTLDASDFEAMTLREIDPDAVVSPAPASAAADVRPGTSIVVTTVDEFLAAIGPDRSIILDGELFGLSTASNYGSVGGEYYSWQASHDGPELLIHDVSGLSISAKNSASGATTVAAIPRYANVLRFRNCDNLFLGGFTAGHTEEPGSCSGGVLCFDNCNQVMLEKMRLYGCGILGIQASNCTSLSILRTEIYECSQGAGQFFQCDGIRFDDCAIHDVPSPALRFTDCGDKSWNGEPISGLSGSYDLMDDGTLAVPQYEDGPPEEEWKYRGSLEELLAQLGPDFDEPPRSLEATAPQARFAAAVQKAIAEDDWEALADRIGFPLHFFTDGASFVIHDREEYMKMVRDGYFTNEVFEKSFNFRQRIADADTLVFGSCFFGNTCLDHLIAYGCVGDTYTEENLKIGAISVVTPFWPGRGADDGYAQAVPPTPQP